MPRLNEQTVKTLPVPEAGNRVHYFAGAILQGAAVPAGFGVCVTANGVRSFVLNYRANRIERRLTIGKWPTWSVLAAVKQARELRQRIDMGEDPLAARRKQEAASRDTFQAIAEEYFRRDGARLRSKAHRERALQRLVYPELGSKDIAAIKRSDIVRLLDRIEDDNGAPMASLTLAYVRRVMSWHATRSDDFRSPIVRGMSRIKPKERARERTLTDDELRAIWKAATGPYGALVRFTLLTGARRAEAARMAWQELGDGVWTLPAARNKTKQDLARPLSKAALAVLGSPAGRFVFPARDGGHAPVSNFSVLKVALQRASETSGWTLHDCRRTARTLMSRAGVASDIAERCLGHVIPGVRGVYDRHQYAEEMRRAYEALAGLLGRIVNPPAANVKQLRRITQN